MRTKYRTLCPVSRGLFKIIMLFCIAIPCNPIFAKNVTTNTSVAIVVDPETYKNCVAEINDYVNAVGNATRKGILILDKWNSPDSIKVLLKKMYINDNLEGAVLIGNIPIPMIRDAHHLTTAFKMNPKRDWKESSVPSDRFYDDFDLVFDFIKQDSDKKLFYYSLAPESAQEITCDIYSARIKAPAGPDQYKLISEYLKKAADAHKTKKCMNKILHFGGHGYNSESMNARMDEAIALTEHFPFLNNETGKLEYIDFSFDKSIKKRLLAAISDKNLDLAILHHHGAEDTQYLNGSPFVSNPEEWIWLARNYFRSKVRSAKDTAAVKKDFIKRFDIPHSWLDDAFDKEKVKEDSLYSANMDIVFDDLNNYVSGSKVIILDACYNGAFCHDDYIAARYLFNQGNTIVVKANSVNTLQDTWTTELIGLLNWGASVGNWAKGQLTLESHLFGDPTFAFEARNTIPGKTKSDINNIIANKKNDIKYWKNILNNPLPDNDVCDIKSLAIKMLYLNNAINSEDLLKIQENSPSRILRLEAFNTNKKIADKNFVKALILGIEDSYELTQRLCVMNMGYNYDPSIIPHIVKTIFDPTTSIRVRFQLFANIEGFNTEELIEELNKKNRQTPYWEGLEKFNSIIKTISRSSQNTDKEIESAEKGTLSEKELKLLISAQRNKCLPNASKILLKTLAQSDKDELRIQAAEAIGWYRYSYIKDSIIKKCKELLDTEKNQNVKNEILKTINRLQ